MSRIKVGVIGAGDWGKNLIRNLVSLPEAQLKWCADIDKERLSYVKTNFPDVHLTTQSDELFNDSELEAIVIASSAATHYPLGRKSLIHKKHTFIEKPLALSCSQAEELVHLSRRYKKILMVGHLLKYHPAITRLKSIIDSGQIGKIYYIYSQRLNLGRIRRDENALWSFAPHDLSVILYLLERKPISISAHGKAYLQRGIHDVVFVNIEFPHKVMAHIHLSWLDPHKIRRLTVVGSQKMVVFDDMEPTDKIKIYDKGVHRDFNYQNYAEYISLRFGDVVIPYLKLTEPLTNECRHFLECIRKNHTPLTDGKEGLKVVYLLEAAQKSLDQKGAPVPL